jgi:uncharacterized protein (TIGR03000 family)
MYSLLLMATLSQGATMPACGFFGGCHGCYGSCFGGWGCHGGGWGCYGGHWRGGCYGSCYGYGGCYGSGCYGYGGTVYYRHSGYGPVEGAPVAPMPAPPRGAERAPAPGSPAAPKPPDKEDNLPPQVNLGARARLIVALPADAALTIDGVATQATSSERVFVSPPLERGRDYTYALEATSSRDGQKVIAREEVVVRAGEETRISLTLRAQTTARK